jgi:hypothetical protein
VRWWPSGKVRVVMRRYHGVLVGGVAVRPAPRASAYRGSKCADLERDAGGSDLVGCVLDRETAAAAPRGQVEVGE